MSSVLRHDSPEARLLLAVLEDAVARMAGANPEGVPPLVLARQAEEAREWVREPHSGENLSLRDVCLGLGLDLVATQAAVLDGRLTPALFAALRRD